MSSEALDLLTHPSEIELIRYLSSLPNEIIAAAKEYEPARMTRYVMELASKYHKFYHDCRVLGNEDDNLTAARLLLCDCVRPVIANILDVQVIGTGSVLRTAVIFFYISNEGVSLTENAAHLGLPIPEKLKAVLEQLHNRETDGKDGDE